VTRERASEQQTTDQGPSMAAMIKLCSEMRKAFQEDLEVLLGQIAVEFGIDHDALLDFAEVKRKESSEAVSEAVTESKAKKVKKTKKAKAESEGSEGEAEVQQKERAKCAAKTAKGTACKNNALADCEFCRVHNKGPLTLPPKAKEVDQGPTDQVPAKKEKKARKSKKAAEPKPEHNHSADEAPKAEEPCERCEAPEYSVDPDLEAQLAEFKAELEAEMDPDYVPDAGSAADEDEE